MGGQFFMSPDSGKVLKGLDTWKEGVIATLCGGESGQALYLSSNRPLRDRHIVGAVLCRARVVEEMQRWKGTASAEHLKFALGVIDGPRFAAKEG
jgi:hypothetical protein